MSDSTLEFSYLNLPQCFYTLQKPASFTDPKCLLWNEPVATELNLSTYKITPEALIRALKNSNERIRNIFTRVLKGHIAVATFKLKKNVSGSKIDIEARKFLKQIGLNYPHGTGHGVGYFLNVHEGPQAISRNNYVKLQQGMVVSNEPGYYKKNEFGIRIENLIYVKKKNNKKYFENFTLAPIDKDLINQNMLNKKEKMWLNNYHKRVYDMLKSSMNKMEVIELKKACSAF